MTNISLIIYITLNYFNLIHVVVKISKNWSENERKREYHKVLK